MKQIKLVIFDWDGTLMNSVGRIVSSMQSAAKNVGLIVPTDDAAKQIIGLSLPIGLKKLFVSITDEQVEAMLIEYKYHVGLSIKSEHLKLFMAYALIVPLKIITK